MIIEEKIKNSILYQHCICEVPTKYKIRIAKLLTEIMKQYNVCGKDRDIEKAFKSIFKSNLNWAIDELMVEVREAEKEKSRLAIQENNAKIMRMIGNLPNKEDRYIKGLLKQIKKMNKKFKKKVKK